MNFIYWYNNKVFICCVAVSVIEMIYQVVFVSLLLLWPACSVPMEEFLPYNGPKLCLIDAVTGMIHTSNLLDSRGVSIDELDRSKCDEFRLSPNDDAGSYNISISVAFPFFTRHFKNAFVSQQNVHKSLEHLSPTECIFWSQLRRSAMLLYCSCVHCLKTALHWQACL